MIVKGYGIGGIIASCPGYFDVAVQVDVSDLEYVNIIEDGSVIKCSNAAQSLKEFHELHLPNISYNPVTKEYIKITKVASEGFANCDMFTKLYCSKYLTTIAYRAFEKCLGLTNVVINEELKEMIDYAFYECPVIDLTVHSPEIVKLKRNNHKLFDEISILRLDPITTKVFNETEDCYLKKDCKIKESKVVEEGISFFEKYRVDTKQLPLEKTSEYGGGFKLVNKGSYSSTLNVPNYVYDETEGKYLPVVATDDFNNTNLESITLPFTLKHLGTFKKNRNLKYVDIASCLNLENNAFVNEQFFENMELQTVKMPKNLKKIEMYDFKNCHALYDISLPHTLEHIGYQAFKSCHELGSIQIAFPKRLKYISDEVFVECNTLYTVNIIFQEGLEEVGSKAFHDIDIRNLTLPKSIRKIKKMAFANNRRLSNIEYKGTVEEWKNVTKESEIFGNVSAKVIRCSNGTYPIK